MESLSDAIGGLVNQTTMAYAIVISFVVLIVFTLLLLFNKEFGKGKANTENMEEETHEESSP